MSRLQAGPEDVMHALNKYMKPEAWVRRLQASTIAFIDTGIAAEHPAFQGLDILRLSAAETESLEDRVGHGTFFAGVLTVWFSSRGLPTPRLLSVQAGMQGQLPTECICTAVRTAMEHGADVINIGASNTVYSPEMASIIGEAVRSGIIVTSPAGNYIETEATYPAALHTVISCGSLDSRGRIAEHSNRHSRIDMFAPGTDIKGPLTAEQAALLHLERDPEGYTVLSGTSFAAASAAAMAAAFKCARPGLGYAEFRSFLRHWANTEEEGEGRIPQLLVPGHDPELRSMPLHMWKLASEPVDGGRHRITGQLYDSWGVPVVNAGGQARLGVRLMGSEQGVSGKLILEEDIPFLKGVFNLTLDIPAAGLYLLSLHTLTGNVLEGLLRVAVQPEPPKASVRQAARHERILELCGNPGDLLFYSFGGPVRYDPRSGPMPGTYVYSGPVEVPPECKCLTFASWNQGLFSEQKGYML